MRKISTYSIAIFLCITFLFQLTSIAVSSESTSFKKLQTYKGQFVDVTKSAWYYSDMAEVYEYGILGGSGGKFTPNGKVTIAEAITFAARLHCLYHGVDPKTIKPVDGAAWYSGYVKYLQSTYIIGKEFLGRYDNAASRAEVANILAYTLPSNYLPIINQSITSVPDMKSDAIYYNAILTLYQAGVVTGSDAEGNFKPSTNITRAELAVIINRLISPAQRKAFIPNVGPVTFSRESLNLEVGTAVQLFAIPQNGANNGGQLIWHTDDEKVAIVSSDGTVTAVANGSAKVWTTERSGKKNSPDCIVVVGKVEQMTSEEIYNLVAPAVFYIESSRIAVSGGYTGSVSGSGFFVNPDGTAYTNLHVIDGQNKFKITTADGQVYDDISIVGYDRLNDIAVLKVNGSANFPSVVLGDSKKVKVGAVVYCIGNPLALQNSVSDGLVSSISWHSTGTYAKASYILISAPISHGSSGGVAVNAYGEAIGITSATIDEKNNVNLIVPINNAKAARRFSPLTPSEYFLQTYGQVPAFGRGFVAPHLSYSTGTINSGDTILTGVTGSTDEKYTINCEGTGELFVEVILGNTSDGYHQIEVSMLGKDGQIIETSEITYEQVFTKFYIDSPGTYTLSISLKDKSVKHQPFQLYTVFLNDNIVGK